MSKRPNLPTELFIVLFFVCFLFACNNSRSNSQTDTDIVTEPEQMNVKVTENIQELLQKAIADKGIIDDSTKLSLSALVNDFYRNNEYKNIWSSKEEWKPVADSLLMFIQLAREYGLFPEDYHNKNLQSIRSKFAADTLAAGSRKDAILWTKADLMLTDAFFKIASHLHIGRLGVDSTYMNPDSSLAGDFYFKNLGHVLNGSGLSAILHSLEPKHKGYLELRKNVKYFLDSANLNMQYTYVAYPFKDSIAFVKNLVKRLKEEGLVSWQIKQVDSVTLSNAIGQYQKKRGLKPDGKIGAQVIRALNTTDAEKFKLIAINLDRYKMLPKEMPKRYIWVNLPSYYLQVFDNDTLKLESRVVVGKPHTRTPLLTSTISDIVTYPQWTIPNSIIVKEILPGLKRNPGYLQRRGYMLMKGNGETVDPYAINWAKYTKGIPYRVVQGSGDANALGVLKFNFPNKYSVYLHDTNQRYLFKNGNRALSHGCVRVQEWEKLAYYISDLDSSAYYYTDTAFIPKDSMKIWLQRKERHIIPVKTKIPVYFRYFTAAGNNGKVVFFEDIYGDDKAAREAWFTNK
jgi:L,D-transpeptidase YcbB